MLSRTTSRRKPFRALCFHLLLLLVVGSQEEVVRAQKPADKSVVRDGEPCKQRGQVTGTVKKQFVCVSAIITTASGRVVGRRLVWELQVSAPSMTVGTTTVPLTTTTVTAIKTCANGGECRVGDIGAGGGIVFYVPTSPQWWGRYMEAAPNGWNGYWGDLRYVSGCYGMSIPGASAVGLGSGRRNTEAVVASCPERNIAASVAADLVLNGKSDWFLPSRDELNEMFPHRTAIGFRVTEDNQAYSSSTFPNAETFWGQLFTDDSALGNKAGQQFRPLRTTQYSYYVRPIRYGESATSTSSASIETPTTTSIASTKTLPSYPLATKVPGPAPSLKLPTRSSSTTTTTIVVRGDEKMCVYFPNGIKLGDTFHDCSWRTSTTAISRPIASQTSIP